MAHDENNNKPSISVRKYIKWGDTFPVENTSTVVLTSPGRYFVDVRLRIPPYDEGVVIIREPSQLDWAFAGTSQHHDDAEEPPRSVFRHWVDSRHVDAGAVVDEGVMRPGQVPGETLESGQMVNPDTGLMQPYEECWVDGVEGGTPSGGWVLRYEEGEQEQEQGVRSSRRGLMVRIGGRVQGVLRVGTEVAVGRWDIVPGSSLLSSSSSSSSPSLSSWTAIAEIGALANTGFPTGLPALTAADDTALKVGEKVRAQDGRSWVCLESW